VPTELTIVHDYLTQRGGAERVVLVFAEAFPAATILTSLYDPTDTFEAFGDLTVRTGILDRSAFIREHHRVALPFLAPWFASQHVDADVVLASSSGWAHEVRTDGRLIVYCHAPARWLYQQEQYLGRSTLRSVVGRGAMSVLGPPLRRADQSAARRASTYLANSTATAEVIRALYGRDAEVLCPPPALTSDGPTTPVEGLDQGFVLCVSRLLAYKQVGLVVDAARESPSLRYVMVGEGPLLGPLSEIAPRNVTFLGTVDDATLRWCYAAASVLVSVSFEDLGLTPLEAAANGTPTVARRYGGYLDTVRDGETGLLLDEVSPVAIARAVEALAASPPTAATLAEHAAAFGKERFITRLREVVTSS
jgi:glycosyltransferase involved in cell wall biosynthesis